MNNWYLNKKNKIKDIEQNLTVETLRELLTYEETTGLLEWNHRHRSYFASESAYIMWNKRFAGKSAIRYGREGYGTTTLFYVNISSHRLIYFYYYGRWPKMVDHINGNPSDNSIDNIRECTAEENARNVRKSKRNTSGYVGVHWCNHRKRWVAKGYKDGKTLTIKNSIDKNVCIKAREEFIKNQEHYTDRHGK